MEKKIDKFTLLEPIEISYSNKTTPYENNTDKKSKTLDSGKLKIGESRGYQGPSIPADVDWYILNDNITTYKLKEEKGKSRQRKR